MKKVILASTGLSLLLLIGIPKNSFAQKMPGDVGEIYGSDNQFYTAAATTSDIFWTVTNKDLVNDMFAQLVVNFDDYGTFTCYAVHDIPPNGNSGNVMETLDTTGHTNISSILINDDLSSSTDANGCLGGGPNGYFGIDSYNSHAYIIGLPTSSSTSSSTCSSSSAPLSFSDFLVTYQEFFIFIFAFILLLGFILMIWLSTKGFRQSWRDTLK